MLSGGSTPYVIYNELAKNPCPAHSGLKLFLSDERMVPPDSPGSNFGNLKPMLRALNAEDRFVPVRTELPAAEAAAQFAGDLQALETISLGLLGMGSDGHTAGLFSLELARDRGNSLARAVRRADGLTGVTVTPALLAKVKRIVFIVTGESKRDIIQVLLNEPETIPAGVALAEHRNVELWTDCI